MLFHSWIEYDSQMFTWIKFSIFLNLRFIKSRNIFINVLVITHTEHIIFNFTLNYLLITDIFILILKSFRRLLILKWFILLCYIQTESEKLIIIIIKFLVLKSSIILSLTSVSFITDCIINSL